MPCRRLGFVTDSLSMLGSIGIERLIPSPLQGAYNGGTNRRRKKEIRSGRAGHENREREAQRFMERGVRNRTVDALLLLMMLVIVDNSLGELP